MALHIDLDAGESVTVNGVTITLEHKSGRKARLVVDGDEADDEAKPENNEPRRGGIFGRPSPLRTT